MVNEQDIKKENKEHSRVTFLEKISKFTLLPPPIFKLAKGLRPNLSKKWLVLDLDETLVHSTSQRRMNQGINAEVVEVLMDKHACLYYVHKRPNVDYFLSKVAQWYKLVIFTASLPNYANAVIDLLDPEHKLFAQRLFRQSCIPHPVHGYIKDLTLIDKDLSQVLLIDNSLTAFDMHGDNAIHISSYLATDPSDQALIDLLPMLDALRFTSDVRHILSFRTK